MIDENALLEVRIAAARVASGVVSRIQDEETDFELFKKTYGYLKEEFEDALMRVEKGEKVTHDGNLYLYIRK